MIYDNTTDNVTGELTSEEQCMEELKNQIEEIVTKYFEDHKLKVVAVFNIAHLDGYSVSTLYNSLGIQGLSVVLQSLEKLTSDIAEQGIKTVLDLIAKEAGTCSDARDATIN